MTELKWNTVNQIITFLIEQATLIGYKILEQTETSLKIGSTKTNNELVFDIELFDDWRDTYRTIWPFSITFEYTRWNIWAYGGKFIVFLNDSRPCFIEDPEQEAFLLKVLQREFVKQKEKKKRYLPLNDNRFLKEIRKERSF